MANQSVADRSSEHSDALLEAMELGQQYSDWSREQLTQSAEFANDIAPTIRRLAGRVDEGGMGTYQGYPSEDEEDMDILGWYENELFEAFYKGFYQAHLCPKCKRELSKYPDEQVCFECTEEGA